MKLNKLIGGIIAIAFCACITNAAKIYVSLNADGNYITNVPNPIADSHAVTKRYARQLYAANALNALPAKCAGGQITGYTPIPGEDLHTGMQHGVDWSTNTRFTVDSTGNNVYDNLTGLIWTKSANLRGTACNWTTAIDYCTNLVYGGYSDWRLPNVREIASLVDLSKNNPCLPEGHPFSAVQASPSRYWLSSSYAYNSDDAWFVGMNSGRVYYHVKASSFYVWPVRAGR